MTAHPTTEWIARQLAEACGSDPVPRYIIRDRDRVYGELFKRRLRSMGIRDRPTAPRSPWQNGHAERLIGSIRRECLDHVGVFGERHLRHLLRSYMHYYNGARTHLSLSVNRLPKFARRMTRAVCIDQGAVPWSCRYLLDREKISLPPREHTSWLKRRQPRCRRRFRGGWISRETKSV